MTENFSHKGTIDVSQAADLICKYVFIIFSPIFHLCTSVKVRGQAQLRIQILKENTQSLNLSHLLVFVPTSRLFVVIYSDK